MPLLSCKRATILLGKLNSLFFRSLRDYVCGMLAPGRAAVLTSWVKTLTSTKVRELVECGHDDDRASCPDTTAAFRQVQEFRGGLVARLTDENSNPRDHGGPPTERTTALAKSQSEDGTPFAA